MKGEHAVKEPSLHFETLTSPAIARTPRDVTTACADTEQAGTLITDTHAPRAAARRPGCSSVRKQFAPETTDCPAWTVHSHLFLLKVLAPESPWSGSHAHACAIHMTASVSGVFPNSSARIRAPRPDLRSVPHRLAPPPGGELPHSSIPDRAHNCEASRIAFAPDSAGSLDVIPVVAGPARRTTEPDAFFSRPL